MTNIQLKLIFLGLFICSNLISFTTFAQKDQAVENAMKETQDLLKNKSQRDEVLKNDAKARDADNKVNAVTGGDQAQSQKLYDISADIMPTLMKTVGNDPVKAMELLQKAQTDPEAFYKSMPEDIRQKIRGVASEIEAKGGSKKQP